VQGSSDLLFQEMAEPAWKKGKAALDLGLGLNAGIRRFKEKWGGEPFLPHSSVTVQRKRTGMGSLVRKL